MLFWSCLGVIYGQFMEPEPRTILVNMDSASVSEKMYFRHSLSLATCSLERHKSFWHGIFCQRACGELVAIVTRWTCEFMLTLAH